MNKCLAHINGVDVLPHYLYTHLECVSEIISTNSLSVELVEIFRFAGKYHDLGKYQDEFQNYLTNGGVRGSVRHAIWGAFHAKKENCIAAIFAIAGHHAGLHNYGEISHVLQYECDEKHYNYIINKFQTENHLSSISEGALNAFNSIPTVLEKELFVRYLFSCLVDADWLDTEKYFNEDIAELRAHSSFDAGELSKKLNDYMSNFSLDGELNILRNKVRLEAEKSATKATGFYSLSLPTGVGKTLCSLNWAVKHAMHNSKKRIIIVLPFISIIDQTASILKTIFGEDYVLEHHSNYLPESANDEVYFVKKLATENWDYPIVITTSVQFFESLFSNRPSKCRKLHNIKDSVVIFDEVQTLPMKYITPTLTMLNNLNTLMRTSFLFCTATQPAFETREGFEGIDNITPLVNDLDAIYKATERVIYKSVNSYEEIEMEQLSEMIEEEDGSVLVVCNTKKKASELFTLIENSEKMCFHLSTSMCPRHRKDTIYEIKTRLKNGEAIIVVSTQLIEAGVDLDFNIVYREVAPLESIIQSGGRCNREGKMKEKGLVNIFKLIDKGAASNDYRTLANFACSKYSCNEKRLLQSDFFAEYYRDITRLYANPDEKNINEKRSKLEFRNVAEEYSIIDSATTQVFIYKYNDESRKLYDDTHNAEYVSRDTMRRISQYSVQLYDNFIRKNSEQIIEEKAGYLVWHGDYDPKKGIHVEKELDTIIL